MLSNSFRNFHHLPPKVYKEEEEKDGAVEEFKRVNTYLTLISLCRKLELLRD